ncbi:MAG TPA: hypothetical protein VGL77_14560 [Armatimonadota bacterium]|jgi:hypothetical protein
MKLLRNTLTLCGAVLAMAACLAQEAPTATPASVETTAPVAAPLPKPSISDVVQTIGKDAKIDWTIFQFRAVGVGVAPEGATGGRAKALAREAAITVAERNLLKVVQGVHISSETQVENLVLASDVIKTKLAGALKGAAVVQEKDMEDGSYLVVVAMPMLGEQGVATAVDLPKQVEACTPKTEMTLADVPAPKAVKGDFTGLLIDCRGLKISPAMSPAIIGPDAEAVYPRDEMNADTLVHTGVVAYYKSFDAAKQAGRVGSHPLIIKASGVKKDGDDMWYTSPLVKQSDAARILAEDARGGFMGKLAVGFLVD